MLLINPIALRKAKIVCNFGLSECNRVKISWFSSYRSSLLVCHTVSGTVRSSGGVVDNTLDYQSRDCKIDSPLLGSLG